MEKYKSIVRNIVYVAIGTIGSKLIYILLLPLYTRWLNTAEFGAADTITTYTDILVTLIFLNISDAIFVYPKTADREMKSQYFSTGFLFIVFMSVVAFLLLSCLSFIDNPAITDNVFFKYKWLIFALLITRYLQYYTQSFVRALDKMGLYSFIGVLLTVTIGVFSLMLIPLYGFYGYIYAIILAQLIASVYPFWKAKMYKYCGIQYLDKHRLKELLAYSIPLAPNSIMWWLISGINRPLMEFKLGLSAIGIYAVANKISGVVNTASSIVSLAWTNSVLDEYGKDGFNQFYNNYIRVIASVYFVCCAGLIIFASLIVRIFSTPEYYDASMYIPILSIGLACSGLGSSIGSIYAAVKKSKYFFYSSIIGGAVSLATIYPLIKMMGLMGVCVSLSLSFFAVLISRWFYAKKFVQFYNTGFYTFLLISLALIAYAELSLAPLLRYTVDVCVILVFAYLSKDTIKKVVNALIEKTENSI